MAASSILREAGRALGPLMAVLVLLSGCDDASQDPMAVVVTEETHSALVLRSDLPTLPDLAARAGIESRVTDAVDGWIGSWEREDAGEGRSLRFEAYQRAAAPLADRLGVEGVRSAHADLGRALDGIRSLDAEEGLEPEMQARIAEAHELHEQARTSLDGNQPTEALARTLEGADLLREMAPESVARFLIARAEDALAALQASSGDLEETQLDRGDRLVRGARLALDEDDPYRAIQRAYYACQVLDVSPR